MSQPRAATAVEAAAGVVSRRRALFGGLAGTLPLDELLALLLSLALLSGSDGPSNAGTTAMVSAAADGTSQGSALGVT